MRYKLPPSTLTILTVKHEGNTPLVDVDLTEENLLVLAKEKKSVFIKGHDVIFTSATFDVKVRISSFEKVDTNIMRGRIHVPQTEDTASDNRTIMVNLTEKIIKITPRS